VRETVSLHFPHGKIDPDGHLTDPDLAHTVEPAADRLLRQLAWWATALRDARTAQPYGVHG
jgi:hypothetical protein